jgi:hypothetical protein
MGLHQISKTLKNIESEIKKKSAELEEMQKATQIKSPPTLR